MYMYIYIYAFKRVETVANYLQTYFPAFQACAQEGKVSSIMCGYNAVNGVPNCAHDLFQNKILRDQWGYMGFIVSRISKWMKISYTAFIHSANTGQ